MDLKRVRKNCAMGRSFPLIRILPVGICHFLFLMAITSSPPPPKAPTHSAGLENFHNKNKEFMQHGCRLFHLKYNPSENPRMDAVWTHLLESGRSKLVLGRSSKIFVLPAPGQQSPTQITQIQQYMKFHIRYTGSLVSTATPPLLIWISGSK